MPSTTGTTTPMDAMRQRRLPDGTEVGDAQLEPDFQQQEDHAELPEHLEDLVRFDQPEDGGADDDAGDDFADDCGDADPFRELRRDLRRKQHDDDVDENGCDVHGIRLTCGRSQRVARSRRRPRSGA